MESDKISKGDQLSEKKTPTGLSRLFEKKLTLTKPPALSGDMEVEPTTTAPAAAAAAASTAAKATSIAQSPVEAPQAVLAAATGVKIVEFATDRDPVKSCYLLRSAPKVFTYQYPPHDRFSTLFQNANAPKKTYTGNCYPSCDRCAGFGCH